MAEPNKDLSVGHLRQFLYMGDSSKLYPESVSYPFHPDTTFFLEELLSSSEFDVVDEIIRVYREGHFLGYETVLYALALFFHSKDRVIKPQAFEAAVEICSPADMMLTFAHFHKEISKPTKGWGRANRRFLMRWYNDKEPKDLAVEVTRVKTRHKWSHKDILCMAHVKAKNDANGAVLKYLVRGLEAAEKEFGDTPEAENVLKYLKAIHEVCHSDDLEACARLIEIHDLSLNHIPSKLLKSKEVSLCLIPKLPLQKLLEFLPGFRKAGLLQPDGIHFKAVLDRLTSDSASSNLGPLETLLALRKWQICNKITPGKSILTENNSAIDDALQGLHTASFQTVKPTGKQYLIALNVNVKMNLRKCAGCSAVTPSHASDIITMALVKAEMSNVTVVVFSKEDLVPVEITPEMNLSGVVETLGAIPPGPVVLSAPLNWALRGKKRFDAFLVFTDVYTNTQAEDFETVFKEYKDTMHLPDTRYIVSSFCDQRSSTPHTDPNFLHLIGFHTKLLKVIQDFSCGVF